MGLPFTDELISAAIVVLVAASAGLSETSAVVGAMGNAVEGSITTMVDLPFIDELISAAIVVLVAANAGSSEASAVVGAMGNAVEGSITTMVDLPFIDELISAAIVVLVATSVGVSEIGTSVCTDVAMDTAIADVVVVAIGVIVVAAAGIRVTFWKPCVVCFVKNFADTSRLP